MNSVRRAVVYSLGQRYFAFALQLVVSIILARLLTPSQTGIYSLAAAAVAIGQLLREFGTGEYVISERNLTRERLRTAYGVTVVTGVLIAAALAAVAGPMAQAYGEPGVRDVLHLLSINFLLLPLGSIGLAVLSRELAFDKIFVVQTSAGLAGAAATVASAWAQMTYLSPAIGSIVTIVVTVSMLAVITPEHVFLRPSLKGVGEVLRFGGVLTLARLVDQVAAKSGDFIISATLGFHATGLFSKAGSLLSGFHDFFGSAISRVATPAFARSAASPEEVRRAYCHAVALTAPVMWMFFGLLGVFGEEIILLLFGPQWMGALAYLRIGAAGSMLWAPYLLYSSLLMMKRAVSWQLKIQLVAAPALLAAYVVGATYSLTAVAALTVLAAIVRMAVIARFLRTMFGIATRDLLRALRSSAWITLAGVTTAVAMKVALDNAGVASWLRLLLGAATAVLVTVVVAAALKHPLIGEALQLLRKRRSA